tara:strand:+ start:3127 stop:3480 length:354 start_codon:yes stop_codon:yes gene_type:complete
MKNKKILNIKTRKETQKSSKASEGRKEILSFAKERGKTSETFQKNLYHMVSFYLSNDLDPGIAQYILIREAMNMALEVSKPDYLLAIATALTAIFAEVDGRLPEQYKRERGENETTH